MTCIKNTAQIIGDYFDKNRSAFVSHRTEKCFGDYEQILSVFGESNVFSMVGIPIMDNDRVDAVFIGLLLINIIMMLLVQLVYMKLILIMTRLKLV